MFDQWNRIVAACTLRNLTFSWQLVFGKIATSFNYLDFAVTWNILVYKHKQFRIFSCFQQSANSEDLLLIALLCFFLQKCVVCVRLLKLLQQLHHQLYDAWLTDCFRFWLQIQLPRGYDTPMWMQPHLRHRGIWEKEAGELLIHLYGYDSVRIGRRVLFHIVSENSATLLFCCSPDGKQFILAF